MLNHKTASEDTIGANGDAEIQITMEVDGRRLVFTDDDIDSLSFARVDP